LNDTLNWAIILQYFTNYELFCKRNGIPLGAHFIYRNSVSLLGLKVAETCSPVNNLTLSYFMIFVVFIDR